MTFYIFSLFDDILNPPLKASPKKENFYSSKNVKIEMRKYEQRCLTLLTKLDFLMTMSTYIRIMFPHFYFKTSYSLFICSCINGKCEEGKVREQQQKSYKKLD